MNNITLETPSTLVSPQTIQAMQVWGNVAQDTNHRLQALGEQVQPLSAFINAVLEQVQGLGQMPPYEEPSNARPRVSGTHKTNSVVMDAPTTVTTAPQIDHLQESVDFDVVQELNVEALLEEARVMVHVSEWVGHLSTELLERSQQGLQQLARLKDMS